MNFVYLDTTPSTNDHAKRLAREGCPEATVVHARTQTAGRGRHGNGWESIPGNLLMSVVLRPGAEAARAGQLSFLAAVALAQALEPLLPHTVSLALKWPNDVLLDGRKAAGILLETETTGGGNADWVVVGIGVNIVRAPRGAACLHDFGAKETTAGGLVQALSARILALYAQWKECGFSGLRDAWMARAVNIGRDIRVRLARETLSGVFAGLDDGGALLLDTPQGRRVISSGEVYFNA